MVAAIVVLSPVRILQRQTYLSSTNEEDVQIEPAAYPLLQSPLVQAVDEYTSSRNTFGEADGANSVLLASPLYLCIQHPLSCAGGFGRASTCCLKQVHLRFTNHGNAGRHNLWVSQHQSAFPHLRP